MPENIITKAAKQPCKYCGEPYFLRGSQRKHQAEWCLEQAKKEKYKRENDKKRRKNPQPKPLACTMRKVETPFIYAKWVARRKGFRVLLETFPEDAQQELHLALLNSGIRDINAAIYVDVDGLHRNIHHGLYRMMSAYGLSSPGTRLNNRVTECVLSDVVIAQLHNWAAAWRCA